MKQLQMNLKRSYNGQEFITESEHKSKIEVQLYINRSALLVVYWSGVSVGTRLNVDFTFETNAKEKALNLSADLKLLKYQSVQVSKDHDNWLITGIRGKISMQLECVDDWTIQMCELGYLQDCEFVRWGAELPKDPPTNIPKGLEVQKYFDMAVKFNNEGKWKEAEDYLTKTIEMEPKKADLYFNRGIMKSNRGKILSAIMDYDKAIELDPHDEGAYGNRAIERDHIGDPEGALSDYNKAIQINPKSSLAYLHRGITYQHLGKMEKACEDWKKAKKLGDKNAQKMLDQYCK